MSVGLATQLAAVRMGGTHVYGDLKPGDVFTFPNTEGYVYVKGKGGWYHHEGSPKPYGLSFRTGPGTAVVKVVQRG